MLQHHCHSTDTASPGFAGSALNRLAVILALLAALVSPAAGQQEPVTISVLGFGPVSWELDVIKHYGLDTREGVEIIVTQVASAQAAKVALQSGAADIIVTDWVWVARQRAEGADFTFAPYTTAVGALMVPTDSEIGRVEDLQGRTIGVAGGPLDKGWLLLQALLRERHDIDVRSALTTRFGAPALMSEQLQAGQLDGVLTFWDSAARLQAQGYRRLIGIQDMARLLGIAADVPLLGYVFRASFAARFPERIGGFQRAVAKARSLLAEDDREWFRISNLLRADDEETRNALRDRYRTGLPQAWGETERADAARLFEILRKIGGAQLVGPVTKLDPGVFWTAPD